MEELIRRVKRNCDIADARKWGYFSICGLLLRLRELYHSEHGLKPWEKSSQKDISGWIARKEALWKELASSEFAPVEIDGRSFDPFDTEGINDALSDRGLLYGAGYGPGLQPSFFLGRLKKRELMDSLSVFTAGREYARDLSGAPAMLKGNAVFARLEANEFLIWQKFEEYGARPEGVLEAAFSSYNLAPGEVSPEKLSGIAESELAVYVQHEMGEAEEGRRLGPLWNQMLLAAKDPKSPHFLRAVKDVLADTSEKGMLKHITENRLKGSLAFYAAFLSGYRKLMSRPVDEAFRLFLASGDWAGIESARAGLYRLARGIAGAFLHVFREGGEIGPLVEESIRSLK